MGIEEQIMTLLSMAVAGIAGWMFHHTVDRKSHLDGRVLVSEEVFSARLSALEDRLKGQITAVKVKLDDLEQFTHHVDRRLEKALGD